VRVYKTSPFPASATTAMVFIEALSAANPKHNVELIRNCAG